MYLLFTYSLLTLFSQSNEMVLLGDHKGLIAVSRVLAQLQIIPRRSQTLDLVSGDELLWIYRLHLGNRGGNGSSPDRTILSHTATAKWPRDSVMGHGGLPCLSMNLIRKESAGICQIFTEKVGFNLLTLGPKHPTAYPP